MDILIYELHADKFFLTVSLKFQKNPQHAVPDFFTDGLRSSGRFIHSAGPFIGT